MRELCIICGSEIKEDGQVYMDCGERSGTHAHEKCI